MSYLNRILARQNIDVNDVDYEQMKAVRRQKNVVNARAILTQNRLEFKEFAKNRFVVGGLDYWPETGLWVDKEGAHRYGCRNLVKYLKEGVL